MDENGHLIHWRGPFESIDDARSWLKETEFPSGIYLAIGNDRRVAYKFPSLKYIGISSNLLTRVTPQHTSLKEFEIESIWIGGPDAAGLNDSQYRIHLEICEWLLVHSLSPSLNDRKTTRPKVSCAVINKFWNRSADKDQYWSKEYIQTKPKHIPNLIHFDIYDDRIWYVDFDESLVRYVDN